MNITTGIHVDGDYYSSAAAMLEAFEHHVMAQMDHAEGGTDFFAAFHQERRDEFLDAMPDYVLTELGEALHRLTCQINSALLHRTINGHASH